MATNKNGKKKSAKISQKAAKIAKIKKIAIWTTAILLPIVIFVVIPLYCRNHFVQTLKISEDIFLSSPEEVNLVSSSELGPCYRIKINGYSFSIPNEFTPSKIDYNEAEFRIKSRSEGRFIFLRSERRTRTMNFNSQGVTKWFLPTETRKFLPMILNANWHPFRLLFKSQFFASEGITSKIFKAKWDLNHEGYIFPTTGNEGYLGRIFRQKGDGTVDFLVSDSVNNVTLRDWVDLAMKIATPAQVDSDYNDNEELTPEELKSKIDDLAVKALDPEYQAEVLGQCLNEFYKSKVPVWLIPVAIVMEARGFFPDVLDLVEQDIVQGYKNEAPDYYMPMWNELIDKAVAESIAIEIDPQQGLRELNIYCKNLTDLDINQVYIRIDILSNLNVKQSFIVPLLSQSYLRNREEKHIQVKCPDDISIANAVEITHRVESLEFTK